MPEMYDVVESSFYDEVSSTIFMNAPVIAIDTETEGLNWRKDRILTVAASISDDFSYLFYPLDGSDMNLMKEALNKFFNEYKGLVVMHNAKFDLSMFREFLHNSLEHIRVSDTVIMAGLLNENRRLGLEFLAKEMYGLDKPGLEDLADRNTFDSRVTFKVWNDLRVDILTDFKSLYLSEIELMRCLMDIECIGVAMDIPKLKVRLNEYAKRMLVLMQELFSKFGKCSPTSPDNLAMMLTELGHADVINKTDKGNNSIKDEDMMQILDDPWVEKILEIRALAQVSATYLRNYQAMVDEEGVLYANFNQVSVVKDKLIRTGRLSSSNPNLQNVPPGIRDLFIPRKDAPWYLFDYNQIELRVLAHYSQDKTMLEAYQKGIDIHGITANELSIPRKKAKTVNFGSVYGIGAKSLGIKLRIPESDAKIFIRKFYNKYPAIAVFQRDMEKDAIRQGYVTNLYGRRRRLVAETARLAPNALIQGSASDLIKHATINVWKHLKKYQSRIALPIHDELIIAIPPDEEFLVEEIKEIMEAEYKNIGLTVSTPVSVSKTTTNWAKAQEVIL